MYFTQSKHPYTILTKKELCIDDTFVAADLFGIFLPSYQPTQQARSIVSFSVIIFLTGFLFFKWIMHEDIDSGEGFIGRTTKKCRKRGNRVESTTLVEKCRYKMGGARKRCLDKQNKRLDECFRAGYKCDVGHIPLGECISEPGSRWKRRKA